jgi:hypothetical protein
MGSGVRPRHFFFLLPPPPVCAVIEHRPLDLRSSGYAIVVKFRVEDAVDDRLLSGTRLCMVESPVFFEANKQYVTYCWFNLEGSLVLQVPLNLCQWFVCMTTLSQLVGHASVLREER